MGLSLPICRCCKMEFTAVKLSEMNRREAASWCYEPPYDMYSSNREVLDEGAPYYGLTEKGGPLAAFFCWGAAAQVPGAAALYARHPNALDFGMGMHPAITGQGLGLQAGECALDLLRKRFGPPFFRLAVYAWNVRARKVWARLGFAPFATHGDFILMVRDNRPWCDATRPLKNGMAVYPGDPPFDRHLYYEKENCGWDMSVMSMTVHAGTHLDAPAHIGLPGGTETIDPDTLNGAVQVIDWAVQGFDAAHGPRVLLKTNNQGITDRDAQALTQRGVRLIGVDGLSVGIDDEMKKVHRRLLGSGVAVLENIALENFAPGWYEMRCLPLLIPGSDGAPVRILLREEEPSSE